MDPSRYGRQQEWDNNSVIVVFSLHIWDDKQDIFRDVMNLNSSVEWETWESEDVDGIWLM
jgi:hypothetical protein